MITPLVEDRSLHGDMFFRCKMKKTLVRVMVLLTVLCLISFAYAATDEICSLTVKVNGLRSSKGVVQFMVYNKDGTIPDEECKNYYQKQTGKIDEGAAYTVFDNLPKGRYAVNVLHDENMNGKIDKGFILPIEGLGFTNYSEVGLANRPNFLKASFDLTSNTTKSIKIIYL